MNEQSVLVVDDAPEIRRLIRDVINDDSRSWCVVATAADGSEGIELARELQPRLVLLDISMPVMDGLEALPHIRTAAPHALIVILSGYPKEVAGDSALAAGAHGYIEKQDIVADLVAQIEHIAATARAHVPG